MHYVVDSSRDALLVWSPGPLDELAGLGGSAAHSLSGVHSWGQVAGVVVCSKLFPAVPQGNLTQQHQASVVGATSAAVVGRFAHHVGEVDSLAEHVPGYWCFGRSYPQTLGQDSYKVG